MKSNGSVYVAAVLAVLLGYFSYQWWFNPNRMVKARLGDIAAALSTPAGEPTNSHLARLAQLRKLATADIHLKVGTTGPDLLSRDAVIAAIIGFKSSVSAWNIDFVDADVLVSSDDAARAYVTADLTSRDPQTGQQRLDSRDVVFSFVRRDGEWLVREAEVKDLPKMQ